jgi:drug/metabolite transporter superfamily protein YnfA
LFFFLHLYPALKSRAIFGRRYAAFGGVALQRYD